MKIKKALCLTMATLLSATGFAACNGGQAGVVDNEKTLNVKVYKSGFGDTFVHAWIDQFEEMYATEGYKINVVEANDQIQGSTVTDEMILGNKNAIDLYITGNVTPHRLRDASNQEDMDMIAASLNDVFSAKPIGANGEENVTIEDKMKDGYAEYFQLNDTYYAFPYRSAPVGLVVNPSVYSQYASEYPCTTDELLAVVDTIREANAFPFAFAGGNAYSYLHALEDVWTTQYAGVEYYGKYCSMDDVTSADSAAALIGNDGWAASLDVISTIQNPKNMANGSINFQHSQAQSNLITGKAAFMVTGAWLQNEMFMDYADRVINMQMIATPVLSEVGVKLGLASDAVLSTLVKCVDEGKTATEAIAEAQTKHNATVTEEQYAEVAKARGVFYDWGIPNQVVVNAYSDKLDIAKLFLRYLASDDAARVAYESSTMRMPFDSANVDYAAIGTQTAFLTSVNNITKNPAAAYIYRQATGKRADYSIGFFNKYDGLEKTVMSNRELTGAKI
ncbi:MAG: extracellular solute-binding protein, partial [Clostridia bacterium]|nr:extracellular solute-binding protein [Clostridia bacterium]